MAADFIYLASPYTHTSSIIREQRYKKACRAAARLMLEGYNVFCPIAHSHPIALEIPDYATNGPFWKKQDVPILRHASRLMVLTIDGWDTSSGIKWEIDLARNLHMPVEYIKDTGNDEDEIADASGSLIRMVSRAGNAIRV